MGLATTAKRDADGINSWSSSTYFWWSPGTRLVSPVMFPPGRARLATTPSAIGSGTSYMTIGIEEVARFTVSVSTAAVVTMTSTFARTRSATRVGSRSPPVREGRSEDEVLALDVVQLTHRFNERCVLNTPCVRVTTDRHETHLIDFPRLLRPGAKRRGQHGSQASHERAAVHCSENRSVSAWNHDYSVNAGRRLDFHPAWVRAARMAYSMS